MISPSEREVELNELTAEEEINERKGEEVVG
jgi:hypothetical protein